MAPLRTRDYQRMFNLAVEVVTQLPHGSAWDVVVAELIDIVDTDVAGLMDVRAGAGVVAQRTWPTWGQDLHWDPAMVAAHPLVRHYVTRVDPLPRTVTEVAGPDGWLGTEVYERAAVTLRGATQQVGIPLVQEPGRFRSLTLGRADVPITSSEAAFLRAVQPLLVNLDRTERHAAGTDARAAAGLGLTRRESAVLTLMAQGLTAYAVARRLDISTATVSKHQQNIYRKLGVTDRLSAVLHARDRGALPGP